MAVKFFGQFLVELGVISRETLLQAIALQESVNRNFGDIVLDLGFMTEADIKKVNRAQRTEDLRFGDMAVKMGLLTQEQIQQVLARQSETHLYIGKAIVRVGGLTEDALQHYLNLFKEDQAEYVTDRVAIPDGVPQAELWEMMMDMTYKMLTRVARLTFRPIPCQVVRRLEQADVAVTMDFTGDVRCRFVFAASADVQAQIARAMLGQDNVSHETREVLDDTVMEFVNVICGNIVAKAAQQWKSLDIMPPELVDSAGGIDIPDGYTALHFPLCLAAGQVATTIIIYP